MINVEMGRYQTIFEKGLEKILEGDREVARKQKASAWYVVTYRPDFREKEKERAKRLLSFPWIVVEVLSSIKMQASNKAKK